MEIEVAAGNIERARSAAEELTRIATVFERQGAGGHGGPRAWPGAAGRRRHRRGRAPSSKAQSDQWGGIGAPYETAVGRMGLAHAHRAEGNEARAVLEFRAAHAAFERIGAVSQAADAANAVIDMSADGTPGVTSQGRVTPVSGPGTDAKNVFRREGDVLVGGLRGANLDVCAI